MYVLEDLWYGNIAPSEREIKCGSRYQKETSKASSLAEQIRGELTEDAKKAFDNYTNAQNELCEIDERDAFIKGVRFGVQMMIDTLTPYDTPLPQI